MPKYRVLKVVKLDRDCESTIVYEVQKRKWFKWIKLTDFGSRDKRKALDLCDALRIRPKDKVVK